MYTLANMIWPAMILAQHILTWWVILLGLIIELAFVRAFTPLSWSRSLGANLAMNAASCVLGAVLIPFAGILWEFLPGIIINVWKGTFNPITWAGTFALAVLINAWIEHHVLCRYFAVPRSRKLFWTLVAANTITVGFAASSLMLNPPGF
jgi:hypothetical protein